MTAVRDRPTTLQGLGRGLAVVQAFSCESPSMTLSEVARAADTSPATARRILLTLVELGFVRVQGRRFVLSPRVLRLGWTQLVSLGVWELARPFMEDLAEEVEETCSAAVTELPEIVLTARVPAKHRIVAMSLSVGNRLPAFATAMGRVLLADQGDADVASFLQRTDLTPLTELTLTEPDQILDAIRIVREEGWAFVDEELERGLRSLAVPLRNRDGRTVAALNLCAATSRVSPTEMVSGYLPAMHRAAAAITAAWSHHPGSGS